MGLDLLIHFLHAVQPTHIFQMSVPHDSSGSVAKNITVDLGQVLAEMNGGQFTGVVKEILASGTIAARNTLGAAEHRQLSIMSYFHQLPPTSTDTFSFPSWTFEDPLPNRVPYCMPFSDVRIKFSNGEVPYSQTLYALNGCLVGLVIDRTMYAEQNHEQSQEYSLHAASSLRIVPSQIPMLPSTHQCVGMGLVRSIDMAAGIFHILAGPTPFDLLSKVNLLVRSTDQETPISLLAVGYKNTRAHLPYTTTMESEGLGSLAWRTRHNLARRRG
ncbi:Polynucleotide 5'-hydroxyl-kinase nol9 [Thoreauomyces humboldtii]|nr:Polynucleotide 5'-hydroxyl-kinase nol9 [Thoreauomyces humboldtii]